MTTVRCEAVRWVSDEPFPGWVEVRLPEPAEIARVIVYAAPPWQWQGTLLDYELQFEQDGKWAHFPFHKLAEFYSDYGTYDVTIDVPQGNRMAALIAWTLVIRANSNRRLHREHLACQASRAAPWV